MALFNYECDEVKRKIDEVSPNYPQLTTFEKEWLFFHKYHYIPGIPVELEYETVSINPTGSVSNAIPFQYKSAILKGQTLVNTLLYEHTALLSGAERNGNTFTVDKSQQWSRVHFLSSNPLWEVNETYTTILYDVVGDVSNLQMCVQNGKNIDKTPFTNNKAVFVMGTGRDSDNRCAYIESTASDESGVISFKAVVLKGDYSNIDIPFFTGMTSVKMPVLTTSGKNLFDGVLSNGSLADSTGEPTALTSQTHKYTPNYIRINPSSYSFSCEADDYLGNIRAYYYDENKVYLGRQTLNTIDDSSTYFESVVNPSFDNARYVRFRFFSSGKKATNPKNIMITNSEIIVQYEPFKSNILTVNEEVELRGIGDVKDELNLLTGEMTQHYVEIVLDGSEEWNVNNSDNEGFYSASTTTYIGKPDGKIMCDKLPSITSTKREGVMMGATTGKVMVSFNRETTGITSLSKFKEKLAQLQLKICYEVNEVKETVNIKINKPYEGTNHYELTANIPCEAILEVPVVSTGKQTLEEINN